MIDIDTLNRAAEHWQTWMLHAAWQSSLVALVLLITVTLFRRMPSPLRYGLLVVALIKFALPPMFPAPTGVFSTVPPPPVVVRIAPTTADVATTATLAETSAHQSPGTPVPGASWTNKPPLEPAPPPPPALTTGAYLMLTHAAGAAIILLWITLAFARLLRTVARAQRIEHPLLVETAAQLKLRRRIRLLTSSDPRSPITPMAFGVLRPTVLIPRSLLDANENELRTIFAHELAHHRRYDLLVNYLQLLMLAAWWFNPLIWLLNRALRAAREDCCDDLLLGRRLTTEQTYSDTLLRAAAELPTGPAIGASLGFAEKLHPLGQRLKRIMDTTRPRPVRLSLIGFAVVLIVAGVVLPGLSTTAPSPRQETVTAVEPVNQDDEPRNLPDTLNGPTTTLPGHIWVPDGVDPTTVTVRVSRFKNEGGLLTNTVDVDVKELGLTDRFTAHVDAKGSFKLTGIPAHLQAALIITGPGLASESHRTSRADVAEALRIEMFREGVLEGTLTYQPDGKPAANVELWAHPHDFWMHASTATDADGRFRFTALQDDVYDVTLSRDFDKSQWTMRPRNMLRVQAGDVVDDVALQLEPGAMVSGSVLDAKTGKPVAMSIGAVDPTGKRRRNLAGARTDESGRFTMRLPAGPASLYLSERRNDYVYPNKGGRTSIDVKPGQTIDDVVFRLEPRDEPENVNFGIATVRGRVLGPDGQPAVDVRVSPNTNWPRGDQTYSAIFTHPVQTDDDGKYEMKVLADLDMYLGIGGRRHSSAESEHLTLSRDEIREMPDFTVRLRTAEISGVVVDQSGKPLPGAGIYAGSKNKRGYSDIKTDRRGRFHIEYVLADEPVEIIATKAGFENAKYKDVQPGTDLRIVMKPAAGMNEARAAAIGESVGAAGVIDALGAKEAGNEKPTSVHAAIDVAKFVNIMKRNDELFKNVKATYTATQEFNPQIRPVQLSRQLSRHRTLVGEFRASDDRFYYDITLSSKARPNDHVIKAFDGAQMIESSPDHDQAAISEERMDFPVPTPQHFGLAAYRDRMPLGQEVAALDKLTVHPERLKEHHVYLAEGFRQDGKKVRLWIDPEASWRARRAEVRGNGDELLYETTAEFTQINEGVWFPGAGTRITYAGSPNIPYAWWVKSTYKLTEASLPPTMQVKEFSIKFRPGMRVRNLITGNEYRVTK